MKNQSLAAANVGEPPARMTRARLAAFRTGLPPPCKAMKCGDGKRKREATEEMDTNPAIFGCIKNNKKRAVLKDVSNVTSTRSYKKCPVIPKAAPKKENIKRGKQASSFDISKTIPSTTTGIEQMGGKLYDRSPVKVKAMHLPSYPEKLNLNAETSQLQANVIVEEARLPEKLLMISDDKDFKNIDLDQDNPQLCSLYAPDIYNNLCVAELARMPFMSYMEKMQKDVTPTMRGILVDWLVEVTEEFKLVPDTLYLTVNFIDRFLSRNCMDRQRLQLLGITCMLIASKYEEVCSPRVDEFCFITDSTYTREEVLTMEKQVLNLLNFQLSAPTPKTFLRRFLRAAHALNNAPSLELEFLANYLTELTLVDYEFLKFIPSMIAAAAVFLARWTLDQSIHPWNSTMVYYTKYKASDLKTIVHAMHDLQMNAISCPLNSIRAKYNQEKFKCVATLSSSLKTLIKLF
ncbi:cyclin-A2-4-like [Impatiens glandulifera]|uniref:cyclin-A2-4-like n=1 Tax=Impatiens glandulifera TaxID=253017 RepID=UPI001FB13C19|nr:cyclin-A2-4-like [Impatiens glandulifera]